MVLVSRRSLPDSLAKSESEKKKRKRSSRSTQENIPPVVKNEQLSIPDKLKFLLVEDYCQCQLEEKVIKLPCSITANDVLKDYISARHHQEDENHSPLLETFRNKPLIFVDDPFNRTSELENLGENFRKSCYHEIIDAFRMHFNKTIGDNLLYSSERNQFIDYLIQIYLHHYPENQTSSIVDDLGLQNSVEYASSSKIRFRKNIDPKAIQKMIAKSPKMIEILSNGINDHLSRSVSERTSRCIDPADLYSPIHLLRMFTNTDSVLANQDVKEFSSIVSFILSDFLNYLEENFDKYFHPNLYEYIDSERDKSTYNLSISLFNPPIAGNA